MGIILIAILIAIDQFTKYIAIKYLAMGTPIVFIDNFLQLNYTENYGAAWSILEGKQMLLTLISLGIILGILWFKWKEQTKGALNLALDMIIAGALGNLIDRLLRGFVVDFIDVKFGNLYDYPVFNFADVFIVIGTFIFAYFILFNKYDFEKGKQ